MYCSIVSANLTLGSIDIIAKQLSKIQISLDKLIDGQKLLLSFHNMTTANNELPNVSIPIKSWEDLLILEDRIKEDTAYSVRMVNLFFKNCYLVKKL